MIPVIQTLDLRLKACDFMLFYGSAFIFVHLV
jgi:hypothetical protein